MSGALSLLAPLSDVSLAAVEVSSAAAGDPVVHGLSMFTVAIILHIVLFVYWLGGDLGVYYSSRFIIKPELSPETRAIAAKIMVGCDMAPRFSLILFGASGVTLMYYGPLGEESFLTGWMVALAWVATLVWAYLSLQEARTGGQPSHGFFHRADLVIRHVAALVLVAMGLYAVVVSDPFGVETNPKWLGAKVVFYGLSIFCGIMIRRALKPFGPSFGRLMTEGSSPEVEDGIVGSIRRSEPWVYAIWFFVLAAAVLGVIKPGYVGL
ncbi:hypothetical protein KG112_01355 [Nocardioides sp. zg-ZUI104]|uniref:hypothetical protein n=1 Tax=Nocardioides faecalis TaxID=2803858 RepID=UPI001BCCA6A1|nr:hypothetical protein [Nocardioides faecalis]MBS4751451.1 hypothetical protein [Nocardioides faecalis]